MGKRGLMRAVQRVVLIAGAVMAGSSCVMPFLADGNLFSSFDAPPGAGALTRGFDLEEGVPTAEAGRFVGDVADAVSSPRFINGLTPAERQELSRLLESIYTSEDPDVDVDTRQQAALLAADVTLKGTNAQTTTNNLVTYFADGGDAPLDNPQELLNAIIPDSAQGDQDAIQAILDSYVAAAAAYEAFGSTLDEDTSAPSGTNMGSVAQNAAVAMLVAGLAETNGGSEGLAAKLASNEEDQDIDTSGVDGILDDGTPLANILDAAGLSGALGNGD